MLKILRPIRRAPAPKGQGPQKPQRILASWVDLSALSRSSFKKLSLVPALIQRHIKFKCRNKLLAALQGNDNDKKS